MGCDGVPTVGLSLPRTTGRTMSSSKRKPTKRAASPATTPGQNNKKKKPATVSVDIGRNRRGRVNRQSQTVA